MRKLMVLVVIGCLFSVAVPASLVQASSATKIPVVKISMSNFRYCRAQTCGPLDIGYLRTSDGPVADNPLKGPLPVKRGSIVTWVYRDTFCDMFSCGGHNVYFENGKPSGKKIGSVPSNKGPKTINTLISQKKGTTIRYYCTVNGHYQEGMTGILKVT